MGSFWAIATVFPVFLPLCLVTLCGGLLLVVGGLVLFRVVRSMPLPPPVEKETFLAQTAPTLLPWQPEAWEDLAAHWRGALKVVGLRGYAQGVVKSLRQPEADGWLAFHVDMNDPHAPQVWLRTSERQLRLDVRLPKTFPPVGEGEVRVDGQPLGRIRLPEGTLLDGEGRPIGRYRRHDTILRTRTPRFYGTLQLGERTIAEVAEVWMRLPPQFRGRWYGSLTPLPDPWPAVRNLQGPLRPLEADWLLAAVALELFFDARWVRSSW